MKISISLIASTGSFETDMNRASKTAQKRMKEIEATATRTAKIVGAAFAGVGVALAAGIIKNTIEAERVQAQLAAALKSTGGAAGLTQDQLNGMAGELQKVTTFGDEAINSAQALLLTFTKIGGDVFPQAIEAAADMATALGTDLADATKQLGKALNDPLKGISALGRAGVQFSEAQKAMIEDMVEAGRVADAQRIILAELETQFGGSAAAARDTLGGALEAAKNAFGDLLEGDTGSEGIKGTKAAIEQLTATMQDESTKRGFQAVAEGLANITNFAAQTIAMLGGVGNAVVQMTTDVNAKTREGLIQEQMRLEDDLKALESGSGFTAAMRARLDGRGISLLDSREGNIAKVKGELAEVIALTDKLTQSMHQAGLAPAPGAAAGDTRNFDGGTTVIHAGAGFGVGTEAGKAAAAAEREAARIAKEGAQAAAEAIKRAEEAQADYLRTTEDLRAELGGPMAQVQLDYTRREDELIALAKLAGLTNEELAGSLDLLEAARLRDVAAIEAQAEAEAKRAQEIADGPLIDQMDRIRDTTAGFFVDLVKNGEDAIDRLQDYLLASALESIGKQIAEGLFGDFGTTGKGSAGSGWASIFGSLFGGARAGGGPVYPGKAFLVGEQGPELFIPPAAGMIATASQTAALGRGRGVTVVNHFSMPGRYDMRTQEQIAATAHRASQRALARGTA